MEGRRRHARGRTPPVRARPISQRRGVGCLEAAARTGALSGETARLRTTRTKGSHGGSGEGVSGGPQAHRPGPNIPRPFVVSKPTAQCCVFGSWCRCACVLRVDCEEPTTTIATPARALVGTSPVAVCVLGRRRPRGLRANRIQDLRNLARGARAVRSGVFLGDPCTSLPDAARRRAQSTSDKGEPRVRVNLAQTVRPLGQARCSEVTEHCVSRLCNVCQADARAPTIAGVGFLRRSVAALTVVLHVWRSDASPGLPFPVAY